jgi:uncharacterized RDD family membrane protein YckC
VQGYGAPQQGYGYGGGPQPPFAPWFARFGAGLIDFAPNILVTILFLASISFSIVLILSLATLGWMIYNRWYKGGATGQSLGKKVMNLRLISASTGQPIGPGMAFARDLAHFVDSAICGIGYLFPLWDAQRQTLADKIVSTFVITNS